MMQETVDIGVVGQTAAESVKRAVLLDQDDDILDLGLPAIIELMQFDPRRCRREAGGSREGSERAGEHGVLGSAISLTGWIQKGIFHRGARKETASYKQNSSSQKKSRVSSFNFSQECDWLIRIRGYTAPTARGVEAHPSNGFVTLAGICPARKPDRNQSLLEKSAFRWMRDAQKAAPHFAPCKGFHAECYTCRETCLPVARLLARTLHILVPGLLVGPAAGYASR